MGRIQAGTGDNNIGEILDSIQAGTGDNNIGQILGRY